MKSKRLFLVVFFCLLTSYNQPVVSQSLAGQKVDKTERVKADSLQNQRTKLEKAQQDTHLQAYQQAQIFWVFTLLLALGLVVYLLYKYLLLQNKFKQLSEELRLQQMHYKTISTEKNTLDKLYENQEDLMRGVAHDLKAPLNRVYGLVDVIFLQAKNLSKEQEKYLNLIQRVANEARNMIQNWLDVKAIESQKLQIHLAETDLRQLLEDLITSYQETAQKKSIKIDSQIQMAVPLYVTDSNLLSRILDNLLSNAVKFSPLNEVIKFSVRTEKDHLIFEVEDHGIGINEHEKSKLFQKFQKLSARPTAGESSTGLGLSIVKTLVIHLKGRVEVESVVGEGSIFRVILPKKYSPEQFQDTNLVEVRT